ncbi:MAG: ATP-binding protein [Pirellulaceae bacterium]|nr:ATP-binding protein [Pirellulaceae bacterium]
MFESTRQLLEAIELGEDSRLELKEVQFYGATWKAPKQDDLAAEIAAFANADGGVIVLGVHDSTKEILGIPIQHLDDAETVVRDLLNDKLEPPLIASVRKSRLPDSSGVERAILRIDIPKSLFVHRCKGRYWVRVGSSKREISPEYLGRLMQQRSQARLIRFDEQTVPGTTVNTLAKDLVERYRSELSDPDFATFAGKLAMLRPDVDGTLRATVVGVLFGTEHPRDFLPNAFVQAVAYRGTFETAFDDLQSYQSDAEDIEGPLDQQVIGSCQFVFRNMKIAGSKDAGRTDMPQYDLTAIFEAIVNAVAHRDYSIHGAKIRLRMFADQLKLHIPGDLANSMDVDALPVRQATRNEAIASLLAKTPVRLRLRGFETPRQFMMDRRGEGVNQILLRSERLSGRRPVYETVGDGELVLTIFAANPPPQSSTGTGGKDE